MKPFAEQLADVCAWKPPPPPRGLPMKSLPEEIEDRRARLAELEAEREQLEEELGRLDQALKLLDGVDFGGKPMKPPPRVAKAKPVRAEPKPRKGVLVGPRRCETCRKPLPPRPKGQTGRNKRFHDECRPSKAKTPASDDEAAPVLAVVVAEKPFTAHRVVAVKKPSASPLPTGDAATSAARTANGKPPASPLVTEKREGKVLSLEERERLLRESDKWQKQCSALDVRGQRCSLPHPHHGKKHNASGREFEVVLPAGSALPRRELDSAAFRGRPE